MEEGAWKVSRRKTKGGDELTDGKEGAKEPQWVGCDIRRTTGGADGTEEQ